MSAFMDDRADRSQVDECLCGDRPGDPGPHEAGTELGQREQGNAGQENDPEKHAGLEEGVQKVGKDFHHGRGWEVFEKGSM